MWSAERFADEARQLEERGQEAEARQRWARAAVKAESVLSRHPRSKWADDALVLQVEGLSHAGSCAAAQAPIVKARSSVRDPELRERAGLAAALCALAAEQPLQAEEALAEALASDDRDRRSRAEYLAGRAAALRLDHDAALAHFLRSSEPAALPARIRALLAAGRAVEAGALMDTLARVRLTEGERADLLAALAAGGGAPLASAALDRQLRDARLPFAEQADLLIADGDRLLVRGARDSAEARYRRAAAVAPRTSPEAGIADVRVQRARIAGATQRRDLEPVVAELTRLVRADGGAGVSAETKALLDIVTTVAMPGETPADRFRSAEFARDSLRAPVLAGQILLDAAAADTGSLYAPKALLGALALLPDRRDSITSVLETRYGTSPYTRAFRGEPSAAYAAAEDSLARDLGIEVAAVATARDARFDAPGTGPRGPWLDDSGEPDGSAGNRSPPAGRAPPARARPRPTDRPARPVQPERPLR
jgi:tetratricopeptide (TPR) repeat protein